ncbi:hypothetical protein J6590_103909 [Homalodisca vitripennis]|nr:hypothetical protein J6590_103909 [Homalodisca vitripennis]
MGLEKSQWTLGVMMDMTKAFDCFSHDRLMEGLERLGSANEILRARIIPYGSKAICQTQ